MKSSNLNLLADNRHISIEPSKPLFCVLLLHGYGGSKEEMLPLGYRLALSGISAVIIDLPGHGQDKGIFNYKNTNQAIAEVLTGGYIFQAIVGHSLGARLAMEYNLPAVCLSPPLEMFFEGRRTELLNVLRVRRVNEEAPFEGLKSVMSEVNSKQMKVGQKLILYGDSDLQTVKDFAQNAAARGGETVKIEKASHSDIITASQAYAEVERWLKKIKKV